MKDQAEPALPSPALPRRLAALVYDSLLVLPIIMLLVALATGLQIAVTGEASAEDYSATLHPFVVQAIAVLTLLVFYGHFWRLKGQTLGMQAWRIRLRSRHAQTITYRQVVVRCLGAMLSAAPLGAGYWWCLFDQAGRSWHDHLSGTELELLPKTVKKS